MALKAADRVAANDVAQADQPKAQALPDGLSAKIEPRSPSVFFALGRVSGMEPKFDISGG